MPKRKKKEKGSGAAMEEETRSPSAASPEAPAPGATPNGAGESLAGRAGALLPGGPASLLNKAPTASGQLPPILKTGGMLRDKDPNAKLLGNTEMDEMEQALNAHNDIPGATGGGMNVFAINKDGISRAVAKFIDRPPAMPLTISFHFPGTFLTHRYVVAIIKGAVSNIEGADITAVQYCDRNVRLGTRGMDNRWLVTVNDMRAKQMLLLKGIKVVNRVINVRSYDEVINEEWREYQRWADTQNRLKGGFGARNKLATNKLDTPAAGGAAAPGATGVGAAPASPGRTTAEAAGGQDAESGDGESGD